MSAAPVISLGRAGNSVRFSSLNDNASLGFIDTGVFRAGVTGKLITGRDDGDSDDLKGLHDVDWGVELGGFAEFYPTDNIRGRVEVRRGIGAHDGVVADVAIDAFQDLTQTVLVSAGPRATFATKNYFKELWRECKRIGRFRSRTIFAWRRAQITWHWWPDHMADD